MNDHPFEIDYVIEILNQIANLSSKFNTHKTKIGGLTYNKAVVQTLHEVNIRREAQLKQMELIEAKGQKFIT